MVSATVSSFIYGIVCLQRTIFLSALEHNEVNLAKFDEYALQAKQLFSQFWSVTKHGYLVEPIYGGKQAANVSLKPLKKVREPVE